MMHRPFLALDQVHQLLDALMLDKGHQDWSVRLIHVGSALSRLLIIYICLLGLSF